MNGTVTTYTVISIVNQPYSSYRDEHLFHSEEDARDYVRQNNHKWLSYRLVKKVVTEEVLLKR